MDRLGVLAFKAHQAYRLPASLHISIHVGQWHVAFNSDDGLMEPSDKVTTDWLRQFGAAGLRAMTLGLDRGVALPLAGSDGQQFDFLPVQVQRLAAQEKHKKRWQRRPARRTKDSRNWVKARRKVARYQRYGGNVRRELAHQTSMRHCRAWGQAIAGGASGRKREEDVPDRKTTGRGGRLRTGCRNAPCAW